MGRARSREPKGIVLDAGALIALDRGDTRMTALLRLASVRGQTLRVPAGVLGQVWRNGRRQAALARFLGGEEVEVVPLDIHVARACGELCAAVRSVDVIDASVVILAKLRGEAIVTSDAKDLRRLDPGAELVPI